MLCWPNTYEDLGRLLGEDFSGLAVTLAKELGESIKFFYYNSFSEISGAFIGLGIFFISVLGRGPT